MSRYAGLCLTSRKPVLVWIHGGGFQNGSSYEMRPYYGENIVRRGDIVWVSLNHRLNVLGFLGLSASGGPEFASSANVGMLDLVAALAWIKENIAKFGGDPKQRHHLWSTGRRRQGERVDAHARCARAIPQSDHPERLGQDVSRSQDSSQVGSQLIKTLGIEPGDLTILAILGRDRPRFPIHKPIHKPGASAGASGLIALAALFSFFSRLVRLRPVIEGDSWMGSQEQMRLV